MAQYILHSQHTPFIINETETAAYVVTNVIVNETQATAAPGSVSLALLGTSQQLSRKILIGY